MNLKGFLTMGIGMVITSALSDRYTEFSFLIIWSGAIVTCGIIDHFVNEEDK